MNSPLGAARTAIYDAWASIIPPPAPASLSSGIAILVVSGCLWYYLDRPLLLLQHLLWNLLVSLTPGVLLFGWEKSREERHGGHVRGGDRGTSAFAIKSEALGKILKLQGTGILSTMQRTRSLSSLGRVFKKSAANGLPGLGNWDNSCYQNSVLQGLASLPSVAAFLDRSSPPSLAKEASTILALRATVRQLNDPSHNGQTLWTPGILKSMSSWQQQDAQEYYSKLWDTVEREVSVAWNSNARPWGSSLRGPVEDETASSFQRWQSTSKVQSPAPLTSPLEGLLAQRVGCLQCGYVEGLSLIPFNCLTIQLGPRWSYTVEACLNEYTALEEIHGVECPKCTLAHQKDQLQRLVDRSTRGAPGPLIPDSVLQSATHRLEAATAAWENEDFSDHTLATTCHLSRHARVTTTKTKQIVIARAPRSLVIHVNRSRFDELTGLQSKNHASVTFPEVLDLRPWALGRAAMDTHGVCEYWTMDPSQSMVGDDSASAPPHGAGDTYVLRALITHHGRHENGHYVAYRPDVGHASDEDGGARDPRWWRLSDEDVSSVTKEQVLEQGGVFMLFYEKMDVDLPVVEAQRQPTAAMAPTTNTLDEVSEATILADAMDSTHHLRFPREAFPAQAGTITTTDLLPLERLSSDLQQPEQPASTPPEPPTTPTTVHQAVPVEPLPSPLPSPLPPPPPSSSSPPQCPSPSTLLAPATENTPASLRMRTSGARDSTTESMGAPDLSSLSMVTAN